MDLRLSPLSTYTPARTGLVQRAPTAPVAGTPGAGFSSVLRGALAEVSAAQNNANQLQNEVQMENPNVSLEETMVAIQKAQIGFQATLHVRNRMVQAYSGIMNMQV